MSPRFGTKSFSTSNPVRLSSCTTLTGYASRFAFFSALSQSLEPVDGLRLAMSTTGTFETVSLPGGGIPAACCSCMVRCRASAAMRIESRASASSSEKSLSLTESSTNPGS
jgi:hypothetical protein